VIESHGILDKAAFLHFANSYDGDQNGYLKHSELSRAASDYVEAGHNISTPEESAPDPRLLSVAEVRAALPDWTEEQVNAWMDKGWSAQQILEQYAKPSPPPAPSGFGDEYSMPVEPIIEPETETEPVVEEVMEIEEELPEEVDEVPSEASLKRLKKAELVELATLQGLDSSGTKADIISRLLR